MSLHALHARTSTVGSAARAQPQVHAAAPRAKLQGLDLAALAAPPAPAAGTSAVRMDAARYARVSAAVESVASCGAQPLEAIRRFDALRLAVDRTADIAARQHALLRLIETLGSEWVPNAKYAAYANGTAGAVQALMKRGLWEPWGTPARHQQLQLTPEQQGTFIATVLAPCFAQLCVDVAAKARTRPAAPLTGAPVLDPTLAEHMRGLAELEAVWGALAKGFWPGHVGALSQSDSALAAIVEAAPAVDRLLVAGAIHALRPEASALLADAAVGAARLDEISAVLFAAERSAPLMPLQSLVGSRLAAAHPLSAWEEFVGEPTAGDVSAFITRLHGAALAIRHGNLEPVDVDPAPVPHPAIGRMWRARLAHLDLDDTETAAKVVALADALTHFRDFGCGLLDETLSQLSDRVVVELAHLPDSPRAGQATAYVVPPEYAIRDAARRAIATRGDLFERNLRNAAATADERRTWLKLTGAAAADNYGSGLRSRAAEIAAAAGVAASALLTDPSTTDEPHTPGTPHKPSDHALQTLVAGAQSLATTLGQPVLLDVDAVHAVLPSRSSAEVAALTACIKDKTVPWCGEAAADAARTALQERFAGDALEPHKDLLKGAFWLPPSTHFAHDEALAAPLSSAGFVRWFNSQRAGARLGATGGFETHAAALLAAAEAFGFRRAAEEALKPALLQSFDVFLDDATAAAAPGALSADAVKQLFALAQKLDRAVSGGDAPLTARVAGRAPLEVLSAPFADAAAGTEMKRTLPDAYRAAHERMKHLTAAEAGAFLEEATDPAELKQRLALVSKLWCCLDSYATPLVNAAAEVVAHAIPRALRRLAATGEPTDADTRRLVLFTGYAARKKLDVDVDVTAELAQRFADAASDEDIVGLNLDTKLGPGLRTAATRSMEQRVTAARGASQLRPLLDALIAKLPSPHGAGRPTLPADVAAWEESVHATFGRLVGAPWSSLWSAVDEAVSSALAHGDVHARVDAVLALLPPSRECNAALERALGPPPVPFSALSKISPQGVANNRKVILRPERRALTAALLTHPDGPAAVVAQLTGRAPIGTPLPPSLVAAWDGLHAHDRTAVVHDAFAGVFGAAYPSRWGSGGDPALAARIDGALEQDVFSLLRNDKDLAPLVARVKPIFALLPTAAQARVATAFALGAPLTDPPAVLRRLLENAGIVAIKVAQQLCEDPNVPARFRAVLTDLLDQNVEVTLLDAWAVTGNSLSVEHAMAAGYTALGGRLGTGSVKQPHRVLGDGLPPLVLAFVKPGVSDEVEQALSAFATDAELAPAVNRVRAMLMRELDLEQEAQAFYTMAQHLAPWPELRVPKVLKRDRAVLLRAMSPGLPVNEILRQRRAAGDVKPQLTAAEKRALTSTFRALIRAALDPDTLLPVYARGKVQPSSFVLTDPHGGNVALDVLEQGIFTDLFDPGQYASLTEREAQLFVQLLVHLAGGFIAPRRGPLVDEFAQIVFEEAQRSQYDSTRRQTPSVDAACTRLNKAWDAAAALSKGDDVGVFLQDWLFEASKSDLPIPDAYFGMAKMLHTFASVSADMELPDVVTEEVARLFKRQFTFKKAMATVRERLGFGGR